MKRFLSWIVMYIVWMFATLVPNMLTVVAAVQFDLLDGLSIFAKAAICILGGAIMLALICSATYFGVICTMAASEAVKPSRKGTRYRVFAIFMLVGSVLNIVASILSRSFALYLLPLALFYIMLLIKSKDSFYAIGDIVISLGTISTILSIAGIIGYFFGAPLLVIIAAVYDIALAIYQIRKGELRNISTYVIAIVIGIIVALWADLNLWLTIAVALCIEECFTMLIAFVGFLHSLFPYRKK